MSDLDLMVARLTAAGALRAYKPNAVPASPAYPYMVVSLDTGQPANYSAAGTTTHLSRRISVQMIGKSWESVVDMARLADLAFREVPLTEFPTAPFSQRELATDVTRDPDDDGLLYALHTYNF